MPHTVRHGAIRAGLIGLFALLAGCASERGPTHSSASTTGAPMHLAGVRVEIEADGLPAQLAPRNRAIETDDPREPWSPNYGTVAPAKTTAQSTGVVTPAVAAMTVPRPQTIIRSAPIDAEDIIRRAVAAHEMRQGD
jgi:hypothetical protein